MNYEQEIQTSLLAYEKSATECAKSEADYKDVDSQVKTKLAQAYDKTLRTETVKTREMMALFDAGYMEWETAVRIARAKYIKWRAQREIDDRRLEVCRSLLSFEKAKARIL